MNETLMNNSSEMGANTAEMSKQFLKQKKLDEIKEKKAFMDKFITSDSNASKATKLN